MPRHRIGKIRRKGSKRDPKAKFFLFCEGQNTEPGYFSAVRNELYGAVLVEIKGDYIADKTWAGNRENRLIARSLGPGFP